MIRTIITADRNNFIITLPDDFLGKQIELIAFVIEEPVLRPQKTVSFTVLNVPEELKMNYRFSREEV